MYSDPFSRDAEAGRGWAAVGMSLLVVTSVVIVGVAVTTSSAAAANSTANPIEFTYVNGSNSHITAVRQDGTQLTLDNSSSAVAIGPARDLDGDSAIEVPYVDSNNELRMVDTNDEDVALGPTNASKTKSKVTTADWNGNGQVGVLYATTGNDIYYVENGSSPVAVRTQGDAATVTGVADITGDGEEEIVYTGTSQELYYYNESSGTRQTIRSSIGSSSGIGVGEPADFDGDGTLRIPIVDTSSDIALVYANGTKEKLTTNGDNNKAPVAAANWTGDSDPEVIYLDSGNVHYVTLDGTSGTVDDSNGDQLGATKQPGIATFHPGPQRLNVTNFTLTNSTGQNVTVSFDTNEDLTSAEVDLSGAENATLTLSDFTESGTYTYTAEYDASTDGNYTATLQYAESVDGDRFDDPLNDSATVDALGPTIDSANLTADGDGLVGPGEQVTVTANVSGDVDEVTANLSAFGAGNVSESVALDGGQTTVNVTGTVDESQAAPDGNYSVNLTASDDQGNTDSATTADELTLDTTPPNITDDAGSDRTITAGETVTFSAAATDENGIASYQWSFGTGDTDTGTSTSYTYDNAGNYTVTLTVTDNAGNIASDSLTVSVESDSGDSDDGGGEIGGSGDVDWRDTLKETATPTPTPTATPTATPTPTPTEPAAPTSGDDATATPTETSTPVPTDEQSDDSGSLLDDVLQVGTVAVGLLSVLLALLGGLVVQRRR